MVHSLSSPPTQPSALADVAATAQRNVRKAVSGKRPAGKQSGLPIAAKRAATRPPATGNVAPARTQLERRSEAESRLLATAREIVARKGWAATTLAEVGEAAGYSRGLAGHHFGSKAGLLRAITLQINNSLMEELKSVPPSPPGLQAILSFISVYLGRREPKWTNTRTLLLLLTEALLEGSENADQMVNFNASMFAHLEDNIRIGIEQGEIDSSVSPSVAAEFIVGTLRGMMLQRLVKGGDIGALAMRRHLLVLVSRALGRTPLA